MGKKAKDPNDLLIDTLNLAIKSGTLKELICDPAAPGQMQAQVGGRYKTTSVTTGDEMTLSGVRMGKRTARTANGAFRVIFEFKPIDPNSGFDAFEVEDHKVFELFPSLEPIVIAAMDIEKVDTDDVPVRFPQARHSFLMRADRDIENQRREAEAKAKRAAMTEKERERKHYEEHPLFGVWG